MAPVNATQSQREAHDKPVVKLHIQVTRGEVITLDALVKSLDHGHGERFPSVWDLLISHQFLENRVQTRGKLVGSRVVATRVDAMGAVLGNKTGCCQHIQLDGIGSNALAVNGVAVAEVNGITGENPAACE